MSHILYSQINSCIDINNRIKYAFPLNGSLFVKPVSSNNNFLLGGYFEPNDSAVILAKTYLDTIVWAKKYTTNARLFSMATPYLLPDGSVVLNNFTYSGNNFYITRLSTNGNVLWAKKLDLIIGTDWAGSNNQTTNPLIICSNAIFLTTNYALGINRYNVIAKLDFNGTILWSKTFVSNSPRITFLNDPPNIFEDTVIVTSNVLYYNSNGYSIDSIGAIITKLNAINGTVISNYKLKTVSDNFIKGITIVNSKTCTGNILSLTGVIGVNYNSFPGGIAPNTGMPFILTLDKNLNTIKGKYFIYSSTHSLTSIPDFKSYMNDNLQTGLLLTDGYDKLGYSVTFDGNIDILRSRVFHPQSSNFFLNNSYYLDNNETVFYSFPYNPSLHQTNLEYSRINNLAPANTLECFGRDTSILLAHIFSIIKDTFSWDYEYNNLLIATPFTITEQPFIINQQTICTQTSICDTIKIKGNSKHCLSNPTATFTVYKNSQCLRKVKWDTDTNFIKVVSLPNDTTINVNFLKPFHGFIKASFEGCVLKDSFFIDVNVPMQNLYLGKDTMLCPGKTIILNAGIGFKSYVWQDGSNNQTYPVNQPGIYFVSAIDSCDNIFKDTINVKPIDVSIEINFTGLLCRYDTAAFTLDPKLKNYTFTPGDNGSLSANTLKLFPQITTVYDISAERTGCNLSDTLLIKVTDCPVYIYFPNAFTPNRDGVNDTFKPLISGKPEQYEMKIYNRYGQIIFSTQIANRGWDGTVKGMPQDSGTFVWLCNYKMKDESAKFVKGNLLLLR